MDKNFSGKNNAGFTIIELVVVFSIIAILSTISIASFVTYTNSQTLRNTALSLRTVLQEARSESSSQVIPNNCGVFQGYEVRICHTSGLTCPVCLTSGDYELDANCSTSQNGINQATYTFPAGVSLVTSGSPTTTQCSFHFIPITGGVTSGGAVVVKGTNNVTQTVTVSGAGVIE